MLGRQPRDGIIVPRHLNITEMTPRNYAPALKNAQSYPPDRYRFALESSMQYDGRPTCVLKHMDGGPSPAMMM